MKCTTVFNQNLKAYLDGYRYIANKGSTRSSKTYSILQLLYLIAANATKPLIISIVSESMPHLKRGCIRDFKEMLQNENAFDQNAWNATTNTCKVGESLIEFFSVDVASKVHGPARDILYINECINVEFETFRQLDIRTRQTVFLDCNPSYEFWMDTKIIKHPKSRHEPKILVDNPKTRLIHSTYKDNDYLTQAQIEAIEANKHDTDWWRVYGEGLTGFYVGAIMQNWTLAETMPDNYKQRWIGIDFGFANDPTAIIDLRLSQGELWIDQLLYNKGYDNMMICDVLNNEGVDKNTTIVADSAEPKSIAEIRGKGWRIEPALKGKDSINTGISLLNRYKKNITARSIGVIDEFKHYKWEINQFGDPTNRPIDKFNHAIDAIRYVALNKLLEDTNSFQLSFIK